jgi:magnesium-protoporphyrin IX monomethyl ester (oxidative) cyclase
MEFSRDVKDLSVLLINPPVLLPKENVGSDVSQPLGLAYVAASVRQAGFPVTILDAAAEGWEHIGSFDERRDYNGLDFEQIAAEIKKRQPRVVGITANFTVQKDSAFRVAEKVKEVSKDIWVVIGGSHVTIRPQECALNQNIDFAVIGEGEITTVELLNKLSSGAQGEEFKQIRGLAFKESGQAYVTDSRPHNLNLDSLPFPARDLLPMHIYFEASKSKRANRDMDKPWATVVTSRGCPFNCVFCSIHLTMGRHWRARSPENVAEELKHLAEVYGVKQLDFEDDNISCDKRRMGEICDLIIKNRLRFEWYTPNGVRADTLDENLLRKMKASGCRELWFAPESGSQRVVNEIIGKRIDLKVIERMVELCRKVGISSNCFFVIGFPGETKEEIEESIAFAQKLGRLGADNFMFSIATPLYGTRLYEQAKEAGTLNEEDDESLMYGTPHLKGLALSSEELVAIRARALSENRKLFVINSINKLFYYLVYCHNPILAFEHFRNMLRIGLIFFRRQLARLTKRLKITGNE